MNTYGKLRESTQAVQSHPPGPDWIKTFENKQRPTPEHVLNSDGVWYLPELSQLTKEEVQAKRKARYKAETDEMLVEIDSMIRQGENPYHLEQEWLEAVRNIKKSLPFPESKEIQTYYKALLPPKS